MRWPFRRRRRIPDPNQDQTATGPPSPGWEVLGPTATSVEPPELTAATDSFLASLQTRRPPWVALEPLGHDVSLTAPRGLAMGVARVVTTDVDRTELVMRQAEPQVDSAGPRSPRAGGVAPDEQCMAGAGSPSGSDERRIPAQTTAPLVARQARLLPVVDRVDVPSRPLTRARPEDVASHGQAGSREPVAETAPPERRGPSPSTEVTGPPSHAGSEPVAGPDLREQRIARRIAPRERRPGLGAPLSGRPHAHDTPPPPASLRLRRPDSQSAQQERTAPLRRPDAEAPRWPSPTEAPPVEASDVASLSQAAPARRVDPTTEPPAGPHGDSAPDITPARQTKAEQRPVGGRGDIGWMQVEEPGLSPMSSSWAGDVVSLEQQKSIESTSRAGGDVPLVGSVSPAAPVGAIPRLVEQQGPQAALPPAHRAARRGDMAPPLGETTVTAEPSAAGDLPPTSETASTGTSRRQLDGTAGLTSKFPIVPRSTVSPVPSAGGCADTRPGEPVPSSARVELESGLGVDLFGVEVRRGAGAASEARGLGARAFTEGRAVHLPAAHGPLHAEPGRSLLAHELTHVAQHQRMGGALPVESSPAGQVLEREARATEKAWARPHRPSFDGPDATPGHVTPSHVTPSHVTASPPAVSAPAPPTHTSHRHPRQRAEGEAEPAAAPDTSPPAASAPAAGGDLDRLAEQLFPKLRSRFMDELRDHRERSGALIDR